MKKISLMLIIAALVSLTFAGCTRIEQGYVGLKAWELGDQKGEIETFGVGRWATNMVQATWTKYPTFKQNYVWTKDPTEGSKNDESFTFMIEGLEIGVDAGVEFSVDPQKVVAIFSEYRLSLPEITDGPLRNYVRDTILDEAKGYTSMEKFITNNELSDMMNEVEISVQAYFSEKGINVSQVYLVNAPRYPKIVTDAIAKKIESTQVAIQKENELQGATADAAKIEAAAIGDANAMLTRATAEAEAKLLLQKSYTPEILQAMWIEKWDGKLPEVMPGDSNLLMNVGK